MPDKTDLKGIFHFYLYVIFCFKMFSNNQFIKKTECLNNY